MPDTHEMGGYEITVHHRADGTVQIGLPINADWVTLKPGESLGLYVGHGSLTTDHKQGTVPAPVLSR